MKYNNCFLIGKGVKMPENSSCSSAGSCTKSSCEGCPSHNGGPQSFLVEQNKFSNIKHVIGVVSGKGGVGKSFVTSSLAVNMAKKGYKVGILDADITGPSIPKMYGLKGPANVDDKGVYPAVAANGVKVMSINLLLPGRGRAGHLERTCHRRNRKTVLDRRHLGRPGLSLRRYAARNR